ncbi:MAG: glutamyl-tRNA reductase, partial [Sedimentisphaerales bacterium]|nr:glutamyl-tRNA reductase [Sedimentisphaerales bacterium]
MKLVLNSISFHNCPVKERELVSLTEQDRLFALARMGAQDEINEAVILSTCNRLEIYLHAEDDFDCVSFISELIRHIKPQAGHIWDKFKQQIEGMDVVRHLFKVAAGLDSQMIGENQVLAQVKKAYSESVSLKMSKSLFHKLFHTAFRVGKAVRTQTDINCGAVSISLAAVELAKSKINLADSKALIIGAGENSELVAKYLVKSGLENLVIANRSTEKAKEVIARLKTGQIIDLSEAANVLCEADLVISSTSAGKAIVKHDSVADILPKRDKPLLIIDLAVPRDIEASIGRFKCVQLLNIDDIDERISINKQKRRTEVPKAQKIVAEFTENFIYWLTERAGFEPAVLGKEHTGFRNQLDQPLRHL